MSTTSEAPVVRPASAALPDTDTTPLDPPSLASYLDRIGVTGPVAPDLATLRRVVAGHPASIPFETIDPFLGRVPSLTARDLVAKLVRGARGGWCFEQGGLLRRALDGIGFRTTGLLARVRVGEEDDAPPTVRSHMTVLVDLPEGPYLADVGIGGMVPTAPLRLEHGIEQETPLEPFRLLHTPSERPGGYDTGGTWLLQARRGEEWMSLYTFDLTAAAQIDYESYGFYLVAHPASHFRSGLVVARSDADGRTNLSDRRLSVHRPDGRTERTELASPSELRDVLEDRFGIDVAGVAGLDGPLATLF